MPIRPENKKLYPKNWDAIRSKVLARAASCEFCGVKNYTEGIRDEDGILQPLKALLAEFEETGEMIDGKVIKIVITIAHLDHNPRNNDMDNLRALCQRCHLRYDSKHHAETRRKNAEKNQMLLLGDCT